MADVHRLHVLECEVKGNRVDQGQWDGMGYVEFLYIRGQYTKKKLQV